ncbi:MAG: 50S ribosomal protein L3 [Acidobacteria bacterium]|nr:50S ribosomal protein L3 [Acidobacteriota bacterium]
MVNGLIGKKLGMTQVFNEEGNSVPVTVIQVGPCVVVQRKTREKDGYDSVQLGLVEPRKTPRVSKPLQGHFKKAGLPPTRMLAEFKLVGEEAPKAGDQILVNTVFSPNDYVHVQGKVIGKGFQGVIKRHGFRGGAATHGSMFHRAPGSIGASAYPSRVLPGMRAAGRMGNNRVKIRKLLVVQVDEENNLLLVKGSVPGSRGSYVRVMRAGS